MDSSEDDEDEGEEWRGDRSSAVSPPSAASRAVTQRSTAGSLPRSTSEHAHTSLWTAHTHAHTHRRKIQVVILLQLGDKRRTNSTVRQNSEG